VRYLEAIGAWRHGQGYRVRGEFVIVAAATSDDLTTFRETSALQSDAVRLAGCKDSRHVASTVTGRRLMTSTRCGPYTRSLLPITRLVGKAFACHRHLEWETRISVSGPDSDRGMEWWNTSPARLVYICCTAAPVPDAIEQVGAPIAPGPPRVSQRSINDWRGMPISISNSLAHESCRNTRHDG
jgi:hypothetical protein